MLLEAVPASVRRRAGHFEAALRAISARTDTASRIYDLQQESMGLVTLPIRRCVAATRANPSESNSRILGMTGTQAPSVEAAREARSNCRLSAKC